MDPKLQVGHTVCCQSRVALSLRVRFFFFFPVANKEAGPGAGVADHGYRPVGAELGLHRGLLTPYPGSSQRPLLPGALAPLSSPFQLHREGGLRKQIREVLPAVNKRFFSDFIMRAY